MRYHPRAFATTGSVPGQTGVTAFRVGTATATAGNLPSIDFSGTNAFTIELWVLLDALVDQMTLVSRNGEFSLETRGRSVYAARHGQLQALLAPDVLNEHEWRHLALSFDGLTMALYIDGAQVSTVTDTRSGAPNSGAAMTIGGPFYGQLDSARFWSVAVDASDIWSHQWVDYAPNTQGLAAQLDLSGAQPIDTSGHSVAVALSNTEHIVFSPAVWLSGNAFVDPYNDEAVNPGGTAAPFTIMAWICPLEIADTMVVFSNGLVDTPAHTTLAVTSTGQISFAVGDAADPLLSTSPLVPGEWHNIACTWTPDGHATMFVDGDQVAATTAMTATGSLAVGMPLVGARAVSSALLPGDTFLGLIESVSVWAAALEAAEVQQYMAATDPITDERCIADYDFSVPPPTNNITVNPTGLVGGAALVVAHGAAPLSFRTPARLIHAPAPAAVSGPTLEPPPTAWLDAQVAEFREFAGSFGLPDAEIDELAERLSRSLAAGVRDFAAGTHRGAYVVEAQHRDGRTTLIAHGPDGPTVIYDGEALDPCTTWAIQFVIALAGAAWTALGFTLNLSKVGAGLTNYLGMRIDGVGLLPSLRQAFAAGIGPRAVYNGLWIVHEYGLLTPMARFLWQAVGQSVSAFTVFSIASRVVLLFGPFAPLEVLVFVTELGYSLWGVQTVWNDPNNCWKSAGELATAPVSGAA